MQYREHEFAKCSPPTILRASDNTLVSFGFQLSHYWNFELPKRVRSELRIVEMQSYF